MLPKSLFGNDWQIAIAAGGRAAAANDTVTGNACDMKFHYALNVMLTLSVSGDSAGSAYLQESDDGSSGWTTIAGSNVAIGSAHNGKMIVWGLEKPQKRYVRVVVARTHATRTIGIIDAVYEKTDTKRSKDVTRHANVQTVLGVIQPGAGS